MATMRGSFLMAAALLVANAATAGAADLYGGYGGGIKDGGYVPPPMVVAAPSGWYFKGYLGMGASHVDDIDVDAHGNAGFNWNKWQKGFDSGGLFGVGVGYKMHRWLRFDVTGEFQGGRRFYGLDSYQAVGGCLAPGDCGSNDYEGVRRTWLGLANAYIDLWSMRGFTPYVGAGVGFARHEMNDFTDTNVQVGTNGFFTDHKSTEFAWALYAGIAYDVTPYFTVDLGYRYAHLGDASTGAAFDFAGAAGNCGAPAGGGAAYNCVLNVRDITSHDVMLGMRYKFGHEEAAYVPIK